MRSRNESRATLTVKSRHENGRRAEFEYEIPRDHAEELLASHCGDGTWRISGNAFDDATRDSQRAPGVALAWGGSIDSRRGFDVSRQDCLVVFPHPKQKWLLQICRPTEKGALDLHLKELGNLLNQIDFNIDTRLVAISRQHGSKASTRSGANDRSIAGTVCAGAVQCVQPRS